MTEITPREWKLIHAAKRAHDSFYSLPIQMRVDVVDVCPELKTDIDSISEALKEYSADVRKQITDVVNKTQINKRKLEV